MYKILGYNTVNENKIELFYFLKDILYRVLLDNTYLDETQNEINKYYGYMYFWEGEFLLQSYDLNAENVKIEYKPHDNLKLLSVNFDVKLHYTENGMFYKTYAIEFTYPYISKFGYLFNRELGKLTKCAK